MAELLKEDEKRWLYRTHGVRRRGVYDEDGGQVALLWETTRERDRETGILMANSREMFRTLDKLVCGMDATTPEHYEAVELLDDIKKAINGGN